MTQFLCVKLPDSPLCPNVELLLNSRISPYLVLIHYIWDKLGKGCNYAGWTSGNQWKCQTMSACRFLIFLNQHFTRCDSVTSDLFLCRINILLELPITDRATLLPYWVIWWSRNSIFILSEEYHSHKTNKKNFSKVLDMDNVLMVIFQTQFQ